ncbi:pyridoxal phosphate-dependent aminotransferase [Candidatus Igneacidithiobacillus taiwanensis]|uniref:pyridoxal phosphate-dependent aminotransferase n=1 Tax=Candidatus Igneacidithiobacillus taiwanensis TaxID=1945924 RepID=UPI002899F455|nr:pyridoxal phosphate-dependent aminotransferase [Candidatus Igneacidithiobacillus taiwanensis]MCE5359758.1 pyridoxal phosphate-dependent aminotransferase [Acidithiobacillus sp.]
MDIRLSRRVNAVRPSPTLAVSTRAAELQRQGKDVVSLGAGEPDFDTPEPIKDAAKAALDRGFTKYTAVGGTPELKAAVIAKFARDNNLQYQAKQVLVSVGGKQSFYNLCQALLDQGDEVIIPAPYWVSYPDMVVLAGAQPVILPTSAAQQFKITPEQLAAAITPATRLLVINSPSNPSGKGYSAAELAALGDVLRAHPQVLIASDDMYEKILFAGARFVNLAMACPDLQDRCIVLNGVSKAYAMTGWRIGYCAGPAPLIAAMETVQSQSTSNPCSIAQAAAQAALESGDTLLAPMLQAFEYRHNYVYERLRALPGVQVLPSDGTFYSFPGFQEVMQSKGIPNDLVLAEKLLEAGVAVVPGSAFGSPGHLRLSFATSEENLTRALDRIGEFVTG